jgi:UDP-N-acetylglucosamine diphosphorylase/glucosamine-1-phosphate N-acetyltransferase
MPLNIILWDAMAREHLFPFTFTRPVAEIRIGILTIKEKYQKHFKANVSCLAADYLQSKYKAEFTGDNLLINASVLPDAEFIKACNSIQPTEALFKDETFLAARVNKEQALTFNEELFSSLHRIAYTGTPVFLDRIWKIFQFNEQEILKDFALLTANRKSQPIHESNFIAGRENIFLEEGASVLNSSLNATSGPIYIGKDAEVMEGSLIRGPFALGEHSTLKLGTKIYGATTIGPHCKVGGEVNNSVFFGYSNKAHDGFIGNAVIGEWCNIGADSNNSNLKNNYEEVRVWNFKDKTFEPTGLTFCGLFLGDHSKCGINTMFNTGTVVGVSSNIFGSGFPRTYIPSFSWGGASGILEYKIDKALETAEKAMGRRNLPLTDADKDILNHIYSHKM